MQLRSQHAWVAWTLALTALLRGAVPPEALAAGTTQPKPHVAVFFEAAFPTVDGIAVERETLAKALGACDVVFLNAKELVTQLDPSAFDLLLMPYGSAFPLEAWPAIAHYLEAGGSWLSLGGVPFSVPVTVTPGGWQQQTRQTQYYQALGITQAFVVERAGIASYTGREAGERTLRLLHDMHVEEAYELYVRLAGMDEFPEESGTEGSHDATLRSLVLGVASDGSPVVAPIVEIDWMQGGRAGGRWLLANLRGTMGAGAIRCLAERAVQGATELTARPSLACYRDRESPVVDVQLLRGKGELAPLLAGNVARVTLTAGKRRIAARQLTLRGAGATRSAQVTFPASEVKLAPGLYSVQVEIQLQSPAGGLPVTYSCTTGFWIFDPSLLSGGEPLTTDSTYLRRRGAPFVVTGTTYMASDTHRQFLFAPNPHVWDQDFGAMKRAGVNLVRTGIWTGWKKLMPAVGAANDSALRALDALVLTARRHDMPVIFTFFAFLPETWGGANPYLDPRSTEAQRQFISLVAQRYRGVHDIVWDLINEPSFCSPGQLWTCRPNYDEHEVATWSEWLRRRYPAGSDEERAARLQELYRALPGEATTLPRLEDFADRNVFEGRRPMKVLDYRLFAQEAFRSWAETMATALHAAGDSLQLVTVGQDEGGTYERPSPHFYADAVQVTSIHNWWFNDDLVWDNVMTKVPGKPNLVEETGVMFYERPDRSAWRTETGVRNLLERKLAISIGTGGAGFVTWIWNTNPYMNSDNEAAIGLFRADRTAKPEMQAFTEQARFFSDNQHLMQDKQDEDVVVVIPHSQMLSVRNFATEATRRCVRALYSHCHAPTRAVSEYHLSALRAVPKLVVCPAPAMLTADAWEALLRLAEQGATLLITGSFDADEHGLPVARAQALGFEAGRRPVAQAEFLEIGGETWRLDYRGEKLQRLETAVVGDRQPSVLERARGKGRILWSPLPVELAESIEPTAALYAVALARAGYERLFAVEDANPSILILPLVFREAVLYTIVSESHHDTELTLVPVRTTARITVKIPAQRSVALFVRRSDGVVLARRG